MKTNFRSNLVTRHVKTSESFDLPHLSSIHSISEDIVLCSPKRNSDSAPMTSNIHPSPLSRAKTEPLPRTTCQRRLRGSTCLPVRRFHVLLNSLFKVLFNFRSRYLFSIGLTVIFSLTRIIPGDLCSRVEEHDSIVVK